MNSKINLVIQREYFERVRKKSFIITTILMPVIMVVLMVVPALIMAFVGPEKRTVLVVDNSGIVAQALESNDELIFTPTSMPLDSALTRPDVDAVLVIPEQVVSGQQPLQFYTNGASSITVESLIVDNVNDIVEAERMKSYNIDNLGDIIKSIHSDLSLQSFRNDETSSDSDSRESSTMVSYALAMVLTFMLYMLMLIYGQMVMTSIIEEKNNRVLEIVVSSVRPMQLMLGKICGIGLVAVTQILIWTVLTAVLSGVLLPALMPQVSAGDVASVSAGVDPDLLQAVSVLGNVGYLMQLFGLLLLFLIGGFMLYAAIYAAIGSSVDNIQDASQLQSVVIFPIIIGMVLGITAAADPTSPIAFWCSFIPFTSPMVMMSRIPFGIPMWQTIVSLAILYASFFAMVWLAGKIYRVGIFMYGKKPTFKDLIKWARYK